MCIIDELYHDWHSMREKPRDEDHIAWKRNEELWVQAEKQLDTKLYEELHYSVVQLIDQESCREFQEGFRLGVQLMLELHIQPHQ